MRKDIKVSIAIPMQQHSYQTAIGLIKGGMLDKYYTIIYYKKSIIYGILSHILPKSLVVRMEGRCLPILTPYAKTYGEIIGLFFMFVGRIPVLRKYSQTLRKYLFNYFAKKTAQDCIKRNISFVWGFDSWSIETFRELSKKNCKAIRILDMASTAASTIQKIINEEYDKKEDFYYTYERNRVMYSKDRVNQYIEEISLADYYLSPSNWVTKSLLAEGVKKDRILYLPHGVDINRFKPKNDYQIGDKLTFLFVGRVEAAKGIRYIFDAFRQLQDYPVELLVVGNSYTWTEEISNYSPNISYLGIKLGRDMPDIYNQADVFILSSLWEGSALSMLEAMASGLPVIASSHSCAPDIITEGKEGFVYDPYNIEELKKNIIWYDNNRSSIAEMGKNSRIRAEQYTWEKYHANVQSIINRIKEK